MFSRVGEISSFVRMFSTICSIQSLAKERSIVSDISCLFSHMNFPGISCESNSTRQPPYTPRLFNKRPLAPPSSN
uniref:Uncharacterized protein n=1 Tax=Rhizophora mucronata TaxID=61149 RepID=A0A2P2N019_RHIMU